MVFHWWRLNSSIPYSHTKGYILTWNLLHSGPWQKTLGSVNVEAKGSKEEEHCQKGMRKMNEISKEQK